MKKNQECLCEMHFFIRGGWNPNGNPNINPVESDCLVGGMNLIGQRQMESSKQDLAGLPVFINFLSTCAVV